MPFNHRAVAIFDVLFAMLVLLSSSSQLLREEVLHLQDDPERGWPDATRCVGVAVPEALGKLSCVGPALCGLRVTLGA
jgi:hypothetical protein